MPRRKFIDKKTATHFTLVHRPQNDPLIHDDTAPSMVLNPTQLPNDSKVKKLGDLASELGSDALSVRDNEGEAANYGVYYDDSDYDYMQHLRDIGEGDGTGQAVFVEASASEPKGKGKQTESLEDALRQLDLENRSGDLLDEEILPSKNLQRLNYQAQQEVPDAIAGFQPDMDPRLREVLEALEDEAYVDDDEDIFQELAKDSRELDDDEFDETYDETYTENDDDGWESDHTAKPAQEYRTEQQENEVPDLVNTDSRVETDGQAGPPQDWMEGFKQFQKEQKAGDGKKASGAKPSAPSELQSSIWTTTTNGGRKKKRKGALTNPSTYSMTSSSLVRTEQLGILDARYERMEENYTADEDDMESVSALSSASSVQGPTRTDFDGLLDEFLGNHSMFGKKYVRKGGWKNGTEQLDEIRRELGPARIRPQHQ